MFRRLQILRQAHSRPVAPKTMEPWDWGQNIVLGVAMSGILYFTCADIIMGSYYNYKDGKEYAVHIDMVNSKIDKIENPEQKS